MRAYRTEQIVTDSHVLTVQLPPGTPTGPAQVIVLFADEPTAPRQIEAPPVAGFAGLADFARWLQTQPSTARSAVDIARQVDDERHAWD
jgi:hypothetical protein